MEEFGVAQDIDQAVKNLEYYEQKKLVAGSFGTDKAKRKLASVMTNRVDDNQDDVDGEGVGKKRSRKGA